MKKYTKDINKATHWVAGYDSDDFISKVTPNKEYKLIWDVREGEYHIIDDEGDETLVFLIHEGKFIIK